MSRAAIIIKLIREILSKLRIIIRAIAPSKFRYNNSNSNKASKNLHNFILLKIASLRFIIRSYKLTSLILFNLLRVLMLIPIQLLRLPLITLNPHKTIINRVFNKNLSKIILTSLICKLSMSIYSNFRSNSSNSNNNKLIKWFWFNKPKQWVRFNKSSSPLWIRQQQNVFLFILSLIRILRISPNTSRCNKLQVKFIMTNL